MNKTINDLDRQFEHFLNSHKNIYIYGAGDYGKCCMNYMCKKDRWPTGFITSIGGKEIEGLPVHCVKDIVKELRCEDGLVLAINSDRVRDEILYWNDFPCEIFEIGSENYYEFQILAYGLFENDRNQFEKIIKEQKQFKEVLIIQLEKTFGDYLWSTALLRELKKNLPNARTSYVMNARYGELMEECPYIDELILYQDARIDDVVNVEMIERVNHFAETVLSLKKYDVVIMPRLLPIHERDAWENILLMQRAQADIRIGHAITVERRKRKRCEEIEELFTKVIRHSRAQHEVRNNLELLSFIPEVKTEQEQMELWLNTEDETVLEKYCESEKNLKIAIAPVGSVGVRSWAAKKYGEVFQKLSHKYKSNFFILGGEDAKQSATIIKEYVGKHAIDLTGKTTLRQAAVVIRQCDVYVGADTGLMHMASALQIPVIMLSHSFRSCPPYFGSTPTRTGPWKVRNIVIQPEEGLDGCTDYCKKKYPHCINQITVDEVEKALEELLESQISV